MPPCGFPGRSCLGRGPCGQQLLGLRRFSERECPLDVHRELALLGELHQPGQVVAVEVEVDVDGPRVLGGGPRDGGDPRTECGDRVRRGQGASPRGVEHRVDPVRGDLPYLLDEFVAVAHGRRSQGLDERLAGLGACPDHPCAPRDGDLDGEVSDTARRPVHQHGVARGHLKAVHDRLVGGQPGDRQSGGLGPAQVPRLAHQLARFGRDLLRVGAVVHGLVPDEADHLVARPESRRRGSGLLDDPGQVPSGCHREEGVHERIRVSGLEGQVRRVERGCLDSHQHEIGEHLRIRNVDDFKDLGTAETLVLNGFHSSASRDV